MKNTYTNEPSRSAALAGALNRPGIEILRYGLVIVLLWIGGMKFTSYEAAGIAPLEMHSPLMNWLYVLMGQRNVSDLLGVIEIALGVGIALRYVYPLVSGIASLLSVGMFLTTLSFLFTTPGWEPTLGFPGISAMPGQFLLKDVVLLGAAIFTASEAFGAPPYFVQVQIEETRADRFLGGQLTQNHIWVRGDIRAGRTPDRRTNLMLNIMRDISLITGVVEDNIWVYVCNLLPTDMVEYGHVLPAPGEERQWFDNLPARLREYLKSLGTTEKNFTL